MKTPAGSTTTMIELAQPVERAFLLAVDTDTDDGWTAEDSLAELASLAVTAGAEVVGAEWQNRRHVDPNWYVGKGRAEELVSAKSETGFDVLIADDELSPAQQRALEELLNVKVIDRSRLILDIFALHAQTHEGRLQVELAQLEYQLPRLTRMWTHLSRTGGGIGTRGPGESQLETDRLLIRDRIKKMKARVDQVRLGDGQAAIITDTVGFIHKLPHQLVDAFRATLEEVNRADVLLEVVDASDPHAAEHRVTVQAVLDELGAGDKPRVVALNKADLVDPASANPALPAPITGDAVRISATTGYGLDALRLALGSVIGSLGIAVDLEIPYTAGELIARIRERGSVELDYGPTAVRVRGRVAPALAGELEAVAAAAGLLEEPANA